MAYTRSSRSNALEERTRTVKRVVSPDNTRSKKKCGERNVTLAVHTDPAPQFSMSKESVHNPPRNLQKDFAKRSEKHTRPVISPKLDWIPSTHGKIMQNSVEPTTSEPSQEIVHAAYNSQSAVLDEVPETRNLDIFWLKSESAIATQYYKGELFVHVREYYEDKYTGQFIPTKRGIRMNAATYYDFRRKIFGFANTLCYPTENIVIGNNVLAIVENKKLRLQNFTKSTIHYEYILLDAEQLQTLRESIYDVDNAILNFIYCDLLKSLVCVEKSKSDTVKDPNFKDLKYLIEADLTPKIEALFYCDGCAFNKCTASSHDCETKSIFEKFESLPYPVCLLTDIQSVAKNFLADHAKLRACSSDFDDLYTHLFVPA